MIALLLKFGGWITDHPRLFCVLVFLAGGLLGVLAGRRMCATPTIKEEATATTAAVAQATQDTKTQQGPWSADTWYFGVGGWDSGYPEPVVGPLKGRAQRGTPIPVTSSVAPAVPAQGLFPPQAAPIAFRHEEHGPTASETHSERESAQSTTQTLKLSETGYSAPQWALSVGWENVLHERAVRLSVRRRILGPFGLEVSAVPSGGAVGVGIWGEF